MKREVLESITHMMFSDFKVFNKQSVMPTNITSCTTDEYMTILKRSRVVAAIHKALITNADDTNKVLVSKNIEEK